MTLALFLCVRRCALIAEGAVALRSLPSTGVMGVRPLLESPVELAGLLPRRPNPELDSANGLGGVGKDENAAREEVRLRGNGALVSETGDACGDGFKADLRGRIVGGEADEPALRVSGLVVRVTRRGGGRSWGGVSSCEVRCTFNLDRDRASTELPRGDGEGEIEGAGAGDDDMMVLARCRPARAGTTPLPVD